MNDSSNAGPKPRRNLFHRNKRRVLVYRVDFKILRVVTL